MFTRLLSYLCLASLATIPSPPVRAAEQKTNLVDVLRQFMAPTNETPQTTSKALTLAAGDILKPAMIGTGATGTIGSDGQDKMRSTFAGAACRDTCSTAIVADVTRARLAWARTRAGAEFHYYSYG